MKMRATILLLTALAWTNLDVHAQISFTRSDIESQIGKTVEFTSFQAVAGQEAAIQALIDMTGESRTWDFTTLTYENEPDSSVAQEYIALPDDTVPASDDPRVADATYAIKGVDDSGEYYVFFGVTDTEHNGYGVWAIQNGETFDGLYDQALLENPFPLTFGVTWTGQTTWSQTANGVTINISQQQDGDANGWGTLITPAGTEEALRYELALTITTTIPGVPTPFTTTSRVINFVTKSGMDAGITITTDPLTNQDIITASYSFEGTGGGTTGSPPASAPTAVDPPDGATDVDTTVDLTWSAVDGATSYSVEVATDDAFTNVVASADGAGGTTTTVGPLEEGTTYFWRVRGENDAGAGPWSSAFSFTTLTSVTAPAAVTLVAPEDGAMDVPTEVTLSWNAADGADTYDVQVATDDAFTGLVSDETGLTATSLTVSGLANNTTYFWRVRAANTAGAGPWSETRSFTTAGGVAVEALDAELPQAFALHQNYPNPFNPTTTLRFDLPETAFVSLTIYDMLGRMVTNLVGETLAPGRYEYAWNAEGLPGGIYVYRIEAGAFRDAGTMVLLK
ncbi:fibronectin type III domain-containing protein [Rhodocaloribacter sp.]